MAEKPALLGATAFKPIERHGLEAVSWFLYDKNNGAIMGRTPKSWLLITIFYIIYYSCLAGFWALCMFVFMQTIVDDKPKWEHENGNIGESPALGVRPSQTDALLDSGIIMFNKDVEADSEVGFKIPGYQGWVNRTQEFLDTFPQTKEACKKANPGRGGNFCENGIGFDKKGVPMKKITNPKEEFLFFNQSALGSECTKANNFGFSIGKPCVILKLNKIYGLQHRYIDNAEQDISKEGGEPEKMPKSLQTHIKDHGSKYLNHVWVDCHGENAMDKDVLARDNVEVKYSPASRGFSSIYYPYMNAKGYQTPLLAVQFVGLKPGVMMHIECRAYAENIKYDRNDRIGKAHFEILMHDACTAGDKAKCVAPYHGTIIPPK